MNPQELRETGQRLFKSRQYAEAIPLLKSATNTFPKDGQLWEELVMAAREVGQPEQAVEFARQAICHHPRSDWLWRNLGGQLIEIDKLDEAEKALDNCLALDPAAPWLWRHFIKLHQKRKNYAKEAEAWERLRGLDELNSADLNYVGTAYYNHKSYAKAVEFYRLAAAANPEDTAPLFNLGLTFSLPNFSQDIDAADAYRRALALNPKYEAARARLEVIKQKLLLLATRARSEANDLVQPEEFFQFYISPFEVFPIEFDGELSKLDPKIIQRARKHLLSEIELNDGRISWLENHEIDKARALALEEELYDERKRYFHWVIYRNKPLLRFLTHGEIEHFLYSDGYFPGGILPMLDKGPEFCVFLSKSFSLQYNLLLSRSINRRAFAVVEALFDGRRWVAPEGEGVCFEGTLRQIDDLASPFQELVEQGKKQKVELSQIQKLLSQKGVVEMFNLLPATFDFQQKRNQLISCIRSLAIDCHNVHSDPELSAQILGVCGQFCFKSPELSQQLEEDSKVLAKIQNENRKRSFSAWIERNKAINVTNAGIKLGEDSINAADVESVRWGIYIRTVNGLETKRSCMLVVSSERDCLHVRWEKRGIIADIKRLLRKKDAVIPISQLTPAEQEACFHKMIEAVIHHLIPPLISKLLQRLETGAHIQVGPCFLTQSGVTFRAGFILQKNHHISWQHLEAEMDSGYVRLFNRLNRDVEVRMPARDTENAVILPILCKAMHERMPSQPAGDPDETNNKKSSKKFRKKLLELIGVVAVCGFLYSCHSINKTSNSKVHVTPAAVPSTPAHTPPPFAPQPAYALPSHPAVPSSESKMTYQVPDYIAAELNRDRQAIDDEKTNADLLTMGLEAIGHDIDESKLSLDYASQPAIDDFNAKVNAYNDLLERLQAQDRLVNQKVEAYNAKLRRYAIDFK